MAKEFVLPDLGEGIAEAQVIRVLVKPGEKIAEDQYLMEVETDKAAVEIPSPFAGIVKKVHVDEGQTVNVGDVIVTFDDADGKRDAAPVGASAAASSESRAAKPIMEPSASPPPRDTVSAPAARERTTSPAAPAVRRLARELGVDLDRVSGSGPGGRITKEDLERHAAPRPAVAAAEQSPARKPVPPPAVPPPGIADVDKWGTIRREPLRQIRKTIAAQMSRSAFTIPHVTHVDEADITELDRLRRQLNDLTGSDPKLTVLTFVIRACCLALRKFPIFNSSFDEEAGQIIYKDYVNLGIAVDTERGLIVPVIRHAEQLGLRGIAGQLHALAEQVRTNQFAVEDLRGGSFTITNVGALGGTVSTPLINYPEVAILGLGRSRRVPVVRGEQIVPALVLPLNLSFDHRATDGAAAARFTREIIGYLETPARFLLD